MRIGDDYRVGISLASALASFGLSKLLAQLFLATWQVLSAGQSDIAARGIWLLAIILPEIAIGSAVLTFVLVATVTRHATQPPRPRLIAAAFGAVLGAAIVFFGADPVAWLLTDLPWPSTMLYYTVSATVAALAFGLGVLLVIRLARRLRLAPAAA